MKICIDPGHSGPVEPGACAGGFSEATLVMAIARFLQQELQLRGHAVLLTRDGPVADDELDWPEQAGPLLSYSWRIACRIFYKLKTLAVFGLP